MLQTAGRPAEVEVGKTGINRVHVACRPAYLLEEDRPINDPRVVQLLNRRGEFAALLPSLRLANFRWCVGCQNIRSHAGERRRQWFFSNSETQATSAWPDYITRRQMVKNKHPFPEFAVVGKFEPEKIG